MAARVRWTGTTAQRGYGRPHQVLREQRLAAYRPGDLCAHGGEPLPYWPLSVARRYLDLPHTADRGSYLPGLSCRRHNRADGAVRGNKMRARSPVRTIPLPLRTSRRW
ncbi:MAG TPA: hypothetical protein VGL33_30690 [Streptosporangiaceae bacterium]